MAISRFTATAAAGEEHRRKEKRHRVAELVFGKKGFEFLLVSCALQTCPLLFAQALGPITFQGKIREDLHHRRGLLFKQVKVSFVGLAKAFKTLFKGCYARKIQLFLHFFGEGIIEAEKLQDLGVFFGGFWRRDQSL